MVGFRDLLSFWVRGLRNGNLRKLSACQKAFYKACMIFTKYGGQIVSSRILRSLQALIDILTQGPKLKAFRTGVRRIRETISHCLSRGVSELALKLALWASDEDFLVYVGFMELNKEC